MRTNNEKRQGATERKSVGNTSRDSRNFEKKPYSNPVRRNDDEKDLRKTARTFQKRDDNFDRNAKYSEKKPYNKSAVRKNDDEKDVHKPARTFKKRDDNYDPNAKYSKKKQLEYKKKRTNPHEPIRLNRYIANSGICSRRDADNYIKAGVISVNSEVVTEMGYKVKSSDRVHFHDQLVQSEKKVYVLLNKPKDCVTTTDDPQERHTVMDLVRNACSERIYPVGRLDRNTTGVLLLTNDGELAARLMHPKYERKKIYQVSLDKALTKTDLTKISAGIVLEDGEIRADAVEYVNAEDKKQIGIEIHSGRNRIVRRMFEHLGYKVMRLDRVYFAGLTKKNVQRGKWRFLSEKEVIMLRMGAFK